MMDEILELIREYGREKHNQGMNDASYWAAVQASQDAAEAEDILSKIAERLRKDAERTVQAPEGWQLVPVVPSLAMKDAGQQEMPFDMNFRRHHAGDVWEAMLSAAPKPEGEQKP